MQAMAICGGGDPTMSDILKNIPIWAFHGNKDTVVPPSGSQDMVDAIKNAGGNKIKLTIYEGVKHNSYEKAWKESELVDWVFKQKKADNKPDAGDGK
jgi:predicted peptidase